jgi:hypothetical protein
LETHDADINSTRFLESVTPRAGLCLVLVIATLFFASWWNRYAPPTADGEAALLAPWAADYQPYRDYFLQAPPGVPMLVQAIRAVAGPRVIGTLTFGAVLRIAGACALYALLLPIARPAFAAAAALVALFVSSTDISDTPFYYNHLGAALIVLGTYLGRASNAGRRMQHVAAIAAAGFFFVFAVAIKQTMVFGAAAGCAAILVLAWPRPAAGWVRWLLTLTAGGTAAVAAIWGWLAWNSLTEPFLFVMRHAPESKGGLVASLVRPLSLLPSVSEAYLATIIAWLVIGAGVVVWLLVRRRTPIRSDVLLLVVLAVLWWSLERGVWTPRLETLFLTALGWWGSLVLALICALRVRRLQSDPAVRTVAALGILSFGIGYCFAVSWPLFENIAFPGLGLLFAVVLEHPPAVPMRRWAPVILGCAVLCLGISARRKFSTPHFWGLWFEAPLYEPHVAFPHPALEGMRISEPDATLYSMVAQVARERTRPGDRIYVYPNMPMLYAIADRRPATYGLAHWVDVCPDFLGQQDAERLRRDPPRLMIIRDDPLGFIAGEEHLYRAGRRSSVRDVVQAFRDLLPRYEQVGVFRSTVAAPIVFLVRRDP